MGLTRVEIKTEISQSSQDKNYWLILKKEQTSHGEKLTKQELYELYLLLKETFSD